MAQNKTWLLWLIPLGCLGVIVISCGGFLMLTAGGVWGIFQAATNNPAYRESVERIKNDPRVIEALGEPVSIGWGGSFKINGTTASFTFPVSGPKASGEAVIDAVANGGKWTFNTLDVNTGGETISLLPKPAIQVAPEQAVDPGEAASEEKKPDDTQPSDPDPESPAVVDETAAAETPSDERQ